MTDKRIKLKYNDETYCIGVAPHSLEELNKFARSAIPSLQSISHLTFYYSDQDGDNIIITTAEGLIEALEHHNPLKLSIKSGTKIRLREQQKLSDPSFHIRSCYNCLKAVFSIIISNRVVGLGIVTNNRLALTTSKVLPTPEVAKNAYAMFDKQGFQFDFDPSQLWACTNDITLVSFLAPYSLSDFQPIGISPFLTPKDGDKVYTLDLPKENDPKSSIKVLELKEVVGPKLFYDSRSPCGPSGSPVFDSEWRLIGIQTSQCDLRNEAVRCSELYDMFRLLPRSSILSEFLQQIQPQRPPQEAEIYQNLLESTPLMPNSVYGVVASKDSFIHFQTSTKQTNFIPLEEKLGDGFSICPLPFGACISGGKAAPRRAWIYFLGSEVNFFRIDTPAPLYTHSSIYLDDGNIYFIGGRNDNIVQRECHRFNVKERTWDKIDTLRAGRSYPSLCEMNRTLYVFGGADQVHNELNSIEKFERNRWVILDIMMPAGLHGVCALPVDGTRVLICGGKFDRTKSNMKLYRLDLSRATFSVLTAGSKLGIMSCCYPSFQRDNIYVYNQNGELIEYVSQTGELKKYKKPIIFDL